MHKTPRGFQTLSAKVMNRKMFSLAKRLWNQHCKLVQLLLPCEKSRERCSSRRLGPLPLPPSPLPPPPPPPLPPNKKWQGRGFVSLSGNFWDLLDELRTRAKKYAVCPIYPRPPNECWSLLPALWSFRIWPTLCRGEGGCFTWDWDIRTVRQKTVKCLIIFASDCRLGSQNLKIAVGLRTQNSRRVPTPPPTHKPVPRSAQNWRAHSSFMQDRYKVRWRSMHCRLKYQLVESGLVAVCPWKEWTFALEEDGVRVLHRRPVEQVCWPVSGEPRYLTAKARHLGRLVGGGAEVWWNVVSLLTNVTIIIPWERVSSQRFVILQEMSN